MQTRNKLKTKKTAETLSNNINGLKQDNFLPNQDEYVLCGAICGDGTYTSINGRGAGSRHDGVKHKLYAKRSDLEKDEKILGSMFSASTNPSVTSSKLQKSGLHQTNKESSIQSSQKRKTKKISLKQGFKTKAKRSALFDKVHEIFDTFYKDQLQFLEEQVVDQLWLLLASISNLYDQLNEANEIIKALQESEENNNTPKKQSSKDEQKKSLLKVEQPNLMKAEFDIMKDQNIRLNKEIQKLIKEKQKIKQTLASYKLKEKNFKKMLKIIESSDPKTLSNALQVSMLKIDDLKSNKKSLNQVVTRSMAIKNLKKEQKVKESIFSSDQSSDFYDEDNTIRNIIKNMK